MLKPVEMPVAADCNSLSCWWGGRRDALRQDVNPEQMAAPAVLAGTSAGAGGGSEFGAGGVAEPSLAFHRHPPEGWWWAAGSDALSCIPASLLQDARGKTGELGLEAARPPAGRREISFVLSGVLVVNQPEVRKLRGWFASRRAPLVCAQRYK